MFPIPHLRETSGVTGTNARDAVKNSTRVSIIIKKLQIHTMSSTQASVPAVI